MATNKALAILQTAQYFGLHHKMPLTRESLLVAYNVAKNYEYTPTYELHHAVHIAETKDLLDKVPTGLTLWE